MKKPAARRSQQRGQPESKRVARPFSTYQKAMSQMKNLSGMEGRAGS
jgi:hypothetical protein